MVCFAVVSLLFAVYSAYAVRRLTTSSIDGNSYCYVGDDAMISMRYAWNLAHGKGLVWNEGERVEGITNTLWTLCLSPFCGTMDKHEVVYAGVITGLVFLLITAFIFSRIARLIVGNERGAVLVAVLAMIAPLAYYPLYRWTVRGLELGLVTMLLSFGVWRAFAARGRVAVAGAIALGLAYWTRPDALIPAAAILVYRGYGAFQRKRWRPVLVEAGIVAALVLALTVFRVAYYGDALPNTYVLKMKGMSLWQRVTLNGIGYCLEDMVQLIPFLLIGVIAVLMAPTPERWLLLLLPGMMSAYAVYVGGDFPMHRFAAPFIPFLLLILFSDCAALGRRLAELRGAHPLVTARAGALTVCLAVAVLMGVNCRYLLKIAVPPQIQMHDSLSRVFFLRKALKPEASVGVFTAGLVPFYTDNYAIDFLGKSDRRIAAMAPDISGTISWGGMVSVPGHNKMDLSYSIGELKPTYAEGIRFIRASVSPEVSNAYVRVSASALGMDRDVFLLKDSPDVNWDVVKPLLEEE